jgi:hypothetical protein
MMKRFVIAAVAAACLVGAAVTAYAGSCSTTCTGSGTYRNCSTYCW